MFGSIRSWNSDACDPEAGDGMMAVETIVVSGQGLARVTLLRPLAGFIAELGALMYLAIVELRFVRTPTGGWQ
jgi:hypothetical protein